MRDGATWRGVMWAVVLVAAGLTPETRAGDDEDFCTGHAHGGVALAAEAARRGPFDEATGRDLLNYPPDRLVDFRHMRVDIDIPDMNTRAFSAVQTLQVAPISTDAGVLVLDAAGMRVLSVESPGRRVTFTHEGEVLTLTFSPPIHATEATDIVIAYTVADPQDGMTWTVETPEWPGRPAQLHTQGETNTNHYWFPCHDFPNERMTTELIVTVPRGYLVSSNGRLVSRRAQEVAGRATETFHWRQAKPHVAYLVTLVVGKFDVVDAGTAELPMPVYVPPGKGELVKGTYGRTAEMVRLFEGLTDEAYPWDRYAQLVVWNFGAGGMENTSATTLYDTAILDKTALGDGDLEGLISHELAHQWFGDLITCNAWEHLWLNEGFATYFTALWREHEGGRDAYQHSVLASFRSVIEADTGSAPDEPGMVSKAYRFPWETFRRRSNPYPKGASILHMLRRTIGDAAFFSGLGLYVDRFKLKTAETSDLRRAMEGASGLSLERFFHQWCVRPGIPRLDIRTTWDERAMALTVSVEQTQKIDRYNPAFAFTLPVWVRPGGGLGAVGGGGSGAGARGGLWRSIGVNERSTTATFAFPARPEIVAIDPDLGVLAELKIDQPASNWLAQLGVGPTFASRVQALDALAAMGAGGVPPRAIDAVVAVAADRRNHYGLRQRALESLGRLKARAPLLRLTAKMAEDARVRTTLIEQLAAAADWPSEDGAGGEKAEKAEQERKGPPPRSEDGAVLAVLRERARSETSYTARGAAVRGLASLGDVDSIPLILSVAETPSQHDLLRQAAVEAMATLDAPEGLDLAVRSAGFGNMSRTRPTAVRAVATLAHHDPERAFSTLAALLSDPEERAARGAGEALVELADPRGVGALEGSIGAQTRAEERARVEGLIEELKGKAGGKK